MENLKRTLFGVVILMILGTVSCKKKQCYHCYHYNGSFLAIKGSDTVGVGFVNTRAILQDSINHYLSLGYSIDTFANGYFSDPTNGVSVCVGDYDIPYLESIDSCIIIT